MTTDPQVSVDTPLGATPLESGTLFRTWAPRAREVHLVLGANIAIVESNGFSPALGTLLEELADGTWGTFAPDVGDGDRYLYWVVGPVGGSVGFKRDPCARELATDPHFPNCPCLVREPLAYPWAVEHFEPPEFADTIIYQLHVGVFWAVDAAGVDQRSQYGKFLDVIEKLPYLRELGVTTVQLLPIQEYNDDYALGYSGLDYYSPETTFQVQDSTEIQRRLPAINALFTAHGHAALTVNNLLGGSAQLKCLVDLCHVHGLSVIFDLVYNHAGGGFGDRSLYHYDRQQDDGDDAHSQYFSGNFLDGKVFAYRVPEVRRFLIDNARFFLEEYRIDGVRYDEVSVIHDHSGGDDFCRQLTAELLPVRPRALHIAEYWRWDRALPVTARPWGLGFSAALDDRLRIAVRRALTAAAAGSNAFVDLDAVRDSLFTAPGFPAAWASVQSLENHDIVRWDYDALRAREERIAKLADYGNPESWYARSRSRVATGLLLTAPGIPMLFMGQEFLEDKPWHDDVAHWSEFLIWWGGLDGVDRARTDHLRFTRELVALRRRLPALRGSGLSTVFNHDVDRVLAFQRWVEGSGQDVIVVASFAEQTRYGYPLPMPMGGHFREVFNSDAYDSLPSSGGYNPNASGNPFGISADGPALAGKPTSAFITLPANSLLVFARD